MAGPGAGGQGSRGDWERVCGSFWALPVQLVPRVSAGSRDRSIRCSLGNGPPLRLAQETEGGSPEPHAVTRAGVIGQSPVWPPVANPLIHFVWGFGAQGSSWLPGVAFGVVFGVAVPQRRVQA